MSVELANTLIYLKEWKNHPFPVNYYPDIWSRCHDLAEAQYQPAKDFFVEGLDDPDWLWRHDCVTLLGFHFPLENEVVEKIRDLLLNDPNSNIRMASASVLGVRSNHPDRALFSTLRFDSNETVKKAALDSVLRLAGVPNKRITNELKRIKSEGIKLTQNEVERIFSEIGVEIPDDFDEKLNR